MVGTIQLLLLLHAALYLESVRGVFQLPTDDDVCNSTRTVQSLQWLHSHRGVSGLVLSYISNESWTQNRGYVYDNALAAVSLLLHSNSQSSTHLTLAQDILDALAGSLVTDVTDPTIQYSLFYCDINSGECDGPIRSGQNAWLAEAFALHYLVTGQDRYASELTSVCNYLLSRLEASGERQCVTGGYDVTWCSVEHAIDSYFALHLTGYLTNTSAFRVGASTIAAGLYGEHMWNIPQSRFNQGYDDTYFAMDVNSWGAVFLLSNGESTPVGVDTAARVAGALSHLDTLYLQDQFCSLSHQNATGYGPYADASNSFHAEVVWSEGTLGVALAHRRSGNFVRAEEVVSGLDAMWSDGSLLYAAAETVVDNSGEVFYPYPSLAGTGWYALACSSTSWAFWRADTDMYEAVFGTYLAGRSSSNSTLGNNTGTGCTPLTARWGFGGT